MDEKNLNSKKDLEKVLFNKHKFKFRKYPNFFILFQYDDTMKEAKNENIKISSLINKFKYGSFKIGNIIASLTFGIFLFAMQSYFLRQNLALTDKSFVSD